MEGKIRYALETQPTFVADQGDVVYAPMGMWHLASSAGDGMSTRIAMNGYVDLAHHYRRIKICRTGSSRRIGMRTILTNASPAGTARMSVPMGAIYIDPVIKRATVNRNECVECYACFNGLSQEHLNPTMVRTMRKVFQMMRLRFDPEPDVCPTAAFEPDELAWPRVVRRAFSDPRVPHESTGVEGRGHRRGEDQRRQRPRQGRRGRIHHRIRPARRGRLVPRHPEDVPGRWRAAGVSVREEESRSPR